MRGWSRKVANLAGAYSYEQALLDSRRLALPMSTIEEQFRRMAFDVTYSYNPSGPWTSSHQMTMNGKRSDFTLDDFKSCSKAASMKRGRSEAIVAEVVGVVSHWRDYADEVGVPPALRDGVQRALRLGWE